ncbi:hypothetical protein F0562_017928 [Nyssa sinensis]|uniref:HIRAN domain-containing protein n=1 Tax=Nyssa sinensis TaxID=561372 RepID=A0A5J4Z9Y5_9ASTE|nr:hypothetical protein F0562_017928 [Nyssa sinensis]
MKEKKAPTELFIFLFLLISFSEISPRQFEAKIRITVLNTRTVQVGHLERSVAKVFAPLMDGNFIAVEAIVSNTPGKGKRFKIPCQVHIFARIEAFPMVKSVICVGGLHLISDIDASFTLSEVVVVKEKKNKDDKSVDGNSRMAV